MCKINAFFLNEDNQEHLNLKRLVFDYFHLRSRRPPTFRKMSFDNFIYESSTINIIFDNGLNEEEIKLIAQFNLPNLIFVSDNKDYVYKLNKTKHIMHITLFCEKAEVEEALDRICGTIKQETIYLDTSIGDIFIKVDDLYYIDQIGRKLAYHTSNGIYYSKSIQSSFIKALPNLEGKDIFFLAEKTKLINIAKIVSFCDKDCSITLSNNEKLYIAKIRMQALKDKWIEYNTY